MNTPQDTVLAYHQRTKHQPQRFAAGPDTLDWDGQPNPFRHWAGAPLTRLPLRGQASAPTWQDVCTGQVGAAQMSRESLALLLALSLGLTAWKQLGPDRWPLRANPSSGNLHPTEAYVLSQGLAGLPDGLYHYAADDHALAQRAVAPVSTASPAQTEQPTRLWLGLSSVQWREAWKYGERAFRYCQLDAGHALGAVRYAAAVLGWQAHLVTGLTHAELAAWMGLDRDADFGRAEREEPEMLIALSPLPIDPAIAAMTAMAVAQAPQPWPDATVWQGQANRLDAHPMYRWPVIDEVAQASRQTQPEPDPMTELPPATRPPWWASLGIAPGDAQPAARLIRERRSAQHFDRRATMGHAAFQRLLAAVMPASGLPWDAWPHAPQVHVVAYAHRVEGVPAGAYVLPRSAEGQALLVAQLQQASRLSPMPGWPVALPLQAMAEHPTLSGTLRTLSCHQAIASDACVAFSLVADFQAPVQTQPAAYRSLLQEAGLIGQALYLQAEAEGLRGTGIGCYFDDAVHELLGLRDTTLQVLYHFTVGQAVVDGRISTEPPYSAERQLIDTPLTALSTATPDPSNPAGATP
jgi:SagB-type dehydrogenase family enzyme